jgi:hypothetical protein
MKKFINLFIKRASQKDLGKKVSILWNPQFSRYGNEKPIWREGTIESVDSDGGFWINLEGAIMICSAISKYGQRRNPFKNIKFI